MQLPAMGQPLVTALVVASWYGSNIGVLLLNKFLLTNTSFRQPVFLTLCHMMACATMGYVVSVSGMTPVKPLKSKKQLWKVCLLATIFCFTIVLGNLSLKYIPISFNQAVGSTTPVFTAVLAIMLQGHTESRLTYLTLLPVVLGVVIATGFEPSFHMLGFIACLLGTAGRALKSVVQAMLLMDPTEKLDAMSLLFYMSSFSVLLLLPTASLLEPRAFVSTYALIQKTPSFFWWLLGNSMLAYFVNLTNFLVTKYTSALTLQVLGNCKGVIATAVSVALFKNPVTLNGCIGYGITCFGVFLYSETKRRAKQQKTVAEQTSSKSHGLGMAAVDVEADSSEPLLKVAQMQESPNSVLTPYTTNTLARPGFRVSSINGAAAN